MSKGGSSLAVCSRLGSSQRNTPAVQINHYRLPLYDMWRRTRQLNGFVRHDIVAPAKVLLRACLPVHVSRVVSNG